jgi:hypothetical protein
VAILGERVLHHRGERFLLASERYHLAADRVVRIIGVDQAGEVGRDVDAELVRRRQAVALFLGQIEDGCDLVECVDPVRQLPAPIVPLLVWNVGPQRRPPADGGHAVGAQPACGIALIDEWLFDQVGVSGGFHG